MVGTTLAHYDIVAAIGRGGMGEVWKARDTRLGRDVAIKTLPLEFATDHERLARFEREARLLAALNHPNIASIYGLERVGDTRFLVLELVEGETLAERVARGPTPVEEALKLSRQIAEGLEAAHDKGVIHRDLKPANVKVTPDGKVKVLDFGLAKALAGDDSSMNMANSPTISVAATRQGFILGTAAYMSPEQAKARAVDKRTDTWAFGCVLFELLAGRPAFPGDDVSDVLASVLKSEPDWNSLPGNLNPRLRELLHRCLQKDPQNRYRDIGDVRMDVDRLLAEPSRLLVEADESAQRRSSSALPWVAAVLLAAFSGTAAWFLKPAPVPPPGAVTRFVHEVPADVSFDPTQNILAVSPAGDQLVYATADGLYLRRMSDLDARRIPGTEGEPTADPFFSPDGQWVGYRSLGTGQLKKIPTMGGAPVFLADVVGSVFGASWARNGSILYVQQPRIMRVPENGGEPSVVVDVKEQIVAPVLLPDGDSLMFAIGSGVARKVVVRSVSRGEQTVLFDDAETGATYLSSGHLVYGSGSDVSVRSFDVKTRRVGNRVPLVQDFFRASADSAPQFRVSASGTLVYLAGRDLFRAAAGGAILTVLDRRGAATALPATPAAYRSPRFSPDGNRIAVEISEADDANIWLYDTKSNVLNQLTFDGGASPLFSPDGKEVTFLNDGVLWSVPADFSGRPALLPGTKVPGVAGPGSWSPDGSVLLFASGAGLRAWKRNNPAQTAEVIVETREGDAAVFPAFSPDGRWFVYMGGERDRGRLLDLYVSSYPVGSGGRQRVTTGGTAHPVWVRKGSEIVFWSFAGRPMFNVGTTPIGTEAAVFALPIVTEPALTRRNPVQLFRASLVERLFFTSRGGRNYDVSSDGQRIVVPSLPQAASLAEQAAAPLRIHVVLNWFEEIKARVPAP
jgi:Tol biopolymer transport system component